MNKKLANRQRHKQSQHRLKPAYAAVLLAFAVQTAQANPVGGSVVNGSASFATSGNTLTVTNTPGTVINWQGFSIGANETTRFAQQSASSAVLNRVVSNDPSKILGTLQSNGRVFLINPNGIVFGAGAVVDVAGLVASTLNLSDADFLAGRNSFTQVPGAANVSNAGNITARGDGQSGGQVFLIAPNVENTGVITAPNGEILLVAGYSVDLVSTSDPDLRVNITAPAGDATNVGQLIASSGSLGLFGTVVRNSGMVSADSATMQGGKIVFKASQRVEAGGTISAQGAGGGTINLLADMQSGTVTVTGKLDASAPVSGNGGFIDTSAAHVQVADTARITTTAANGNSGNWLIDPTDFVIAAIDPANGSSYMSNTVLSTSLGSGNVTIQTLASGTGNGDIFVNDAVNWLSTSNLTLNAIRNVEINAPITSGGAFANPGSLTVRADLNGTGTGTIIFGASGNVALQGGSVAVFYGAVNLFYNPTSYSTPTDYSASVLTPFTAWMLVNDVGLETGGTLGLQAMNTNLAGNYALGRNIDATATATWNAGAGFVPVGDGTVNFTGKFNGLGHTIGNLAINSAGGDAGLFGVVGAGGVVANVGLINSSVVAAGSNVGALAGNNAGSIYNSYVSNGIVNVPGAYGGIGGLVGNNSGTISSSYVSGGSVTGQYYQVGGLAGRNSGTIGDSYVSGSSVAITGTGAAFGSAGGLVGYNSGSISNSYASNGSVSGGLIGGVVGYNDLTGAVSNTFWNTDTTGILAAVGTNLGTITNVIGLTTAQMLTQASYTGFDFTNTWWMLEGNTRPFLRSEYSTNINNAHQLQMMAMDLGASYTLDTNIDMSETSLPSGMWSSAGFAPVGNYLYTFGYPAFTGQFDGLGHTISNLYINLPGQDYVGLFGYMSGSVSNVGLVNASVTGNYYVGGLAGVNAGTINNSSASGSVKGNYYVGGLAGINYGTINNSSAGGNLTGSYYVGGLVGTNYGTINNSYAAASMSGSGSVGGLAGANYGTISSSYVSSGYIWGSSHVGGLVGQNNGVLTNSHYDIDVVALMDSAGTYVTLGGLYDIQYQDWLTNNLSLDIANYTSSLTPAGTNSYTISTVKGMKDLLGFADNPAYTFSLAADIDLATATSDLGYATDLYIPYLAASFNGSDGTNFYTISNLKVSQSFNDNLGMFGNIASGSTVNNVILSNAVVTGNSNVGALAGWNQGTISSSHVIGVSTSVSGVNNVGGLAGRNDGTISNSDVSNATVSATGNDVGGLVGYNQANTSYNSSSVLTSIGGTISNSFVSNGTVSGGTDVGGLVGYSKKGSISNSYVNGGTVTGIVGSFGGNRIGGLVGYNNSTIDFGSVYGGVQVKGVNSVGGLVGYNDGAEGGGVITNSSFSDGTVTGNTDVGGLVGYMNYSSTYFGKVGGIISSNSFVSNATVTASGNDAGGLVGYNAGTISGSFVSGGSVTGSGTSSNDIGGLVGYNIGAIDTSSVKAGNVTGVSNVGGLVGQNGGTSTSYQYVGTISKSYVDTGTIVSGGNKVGGLVGLNGGGVSVDGGNPTSSTISNSYVNGGTVSGSSSVGGLVGYNVGTINKGSYVSGGSVSGSNDVGGLVGYNTGTIDTSFVEAGNVTGASNVGGLVGYNGGATISGSFVGGTISNSFASNGTVSASSSNVGGLVGLNAGTISNTYASGGTVSGSSSNVGGLVGYNTSTGSISNSYVSGGTVTGASSVGGLVGLNDGTISDSFWDTQTTGQTNAVGGGLGTTTNVVGLLTADMRKMASFSSWNISTPNTIANTGGAGAVWRIYEGYTTPLLTSFLKPLTIAAAPVSAVYTGTAYSGPLVNPVYSPPSPDLTHVLGNAYGNATNAGTYAPAQYSDQLGYDISYVTGTGLLTITPAALDLLSVTANDASKPYGSTFTFAGTAFTPVGLLNGDTIGSVTLTSAGAVNTANAGSYAIIPSNAVFSVPGNASNYTITYVNGVLTVTPISVTIAANAATKVYGNADVLTFTASGLMLWDTNATAFTGALGRDVGENVGTYAINNTGTLASKNYTFTGITTNNLIITQAPLTVTANATSKILNTADPLLTYTVSGLKFTDTAATTLNGGSLSRVPGETVGNYQISQGKLALISTNYTMAYVSASLTILVPTVINEIVDISNQKRKKPEDVLAVNIPTGNGGNTSTLPMCN